jgi:hypothetical protein
VLIFDWYRHFGWIKAERLISCICVIIFNLIVNALVRINMSNNIMQLLKNGRIYNGKHATCVKSIISIYGSFFARKKMLKSNEKQKKPYGNCDKCVKD